MDINKYIKTGDAASFVQAISQSAVGDTVTVSILRLSDGYYYDFDAGAFVVGSASGVMTFVSGEVWKQAFTPPTSDLYIVTINDVTLDVKYYQYLQASGDIAGGVLGDSEDDFTYVAGSTIAKVRELIFDTDSTEFIVTDSMINTFYELSGSIYLSAALALTAISASRALLAKKRSIGDYSEDLSIIAKECRETAKTYREMADNKARDELAEPADAQAEVIYNDFSEREIIENQALRD